MTTDNRLSDSDLTVLVERAAEGVWDSKLPHVEGLVPWCDLHPASKNTYREQVLPVIFHGTKALHELGYRKPRTITTVEELGALFEGAYGTDADGLLWTIEGSGFAWINIAEGPDEKYRDDEIKLPFILLSPEAEARV